MWETKTEVRYPTGKATVRLLNWVGLGTSLTGLVCADENAVVVQLDDGQEYTIPYHGVAHIAWDKSDDTD